MEAIGLLVTLEARVGKEADVEAFLKSAQSLALDEESDLEMVCDQAPEGGEVPVFQTASSAKEAGRNAHPGRRGEKHWGRWPASCLRFLRKWKKSRSLQPRL